MFFYVLMLKHIQMRYGKNRKWIILTRLYLHSEQMIISLHMKLIKVVIFNFWRNSKNFVGNSKAIPFL